MSRFLKIAAVVALLGLGGCAVVPAPATYEYGYVGPSVSVVATPPPVIVAPRPYYAPPPRYYGPPPGRGWGYGGYGGYRGYGRW